MSAMNRRLAWFALSTAIVIAGAAPYARPPHATAQVNVLATAHLAPADDRAPTVLSVRGTIERYDVASRTLSLATADGTWSFPIIPTTRIRQGWRTIDLNELQTLAHAEATVRYTESGGHRLVHSIHVFAK